MLTNTSRLSLVLAFATALTLTGLSKPRVADAQAITTTTNTQNPFNPTLFVACANGGAGEFVQFSGEIHALFHVTVNGNHVTFRTHSQPQGVSGVGLTTGDTYHAVGGSRAIDSFQSDGATFVTTIVNNTRFLGPGPNNDLMVHSVFHLTFNNNGELTSSQSNFSSECK